MFAPTPGQERSEAEYRTLLEKADFKLYRAIATNSAVSIVEATLRNSLPPNDRVRGTSPWRYPQVALHWNRKRVPARLTCENDENVMRSQALRLLFHLVHPVMVRTWPRDEVG